MKLSKAQLFNSLGLVSNIASNAAWNAINKLERRIRAEKAFPLFISNEDMDDDIKIVKSLEDSGVLVDGVTEAVKHEIKNKNVYFLGLC